MNLAERGFGAGGGKPHFAVSKTCMNKVGGFGLMLVFNVHNRQAGWNRGKMPPVPGFMPRAGGLIVFEQGV